jgi:hypothetical protein
VANPRPPSSDQIRFLTYSFRHDLTEIPRNIFVMRGSIMTVLLNSLILSAMHEIKKYYMFAGAKELFLRRIKVNWFKFFRIGSFVRVTFYSEAYTNLKFTGICIKKSFHGIGSTFTSANGIGLKYKYLVFMPTIVRLVPLHFLNASMVWRND